MQRNGEVKFWEAECLKVDAMNKKVICRSSANENLPGNNEFSLEYDYLVVAVGAQVNTFNTPGVSENCYFLKVINFHVYKIIETWFCDFSLLIINVVSCRKSKMLKASAGL